MYSKLFGAVLLLAVTSLAGCGLHEDGLVTGSLHDDSSSIHGKPPLDDEAAARKHFAAGHYGQAEAHYRRAVELRPDNGDAWIGLAASYDQLRRFDLAKRAYDRAMTIQGRSPLLLNNLGYHYYLQGEKAKAEHHWRSAAALEPSNDKIQANLQLLGGTHAR